MYQSVHQAALYINGELIAETSKEILKRKKEEEELIENLKLEINKAGFKLNDIHLLDTKENMNIKRGIKCTEIKRAMQTAQLEER